MKSLVHELASLTEPEPKPKLEDFSRARAPLHNPAIPRFEAQKEQPWHRTMAWMLAKGFTQKEIAQAVDRNEATVSLAALQSFMKQMVVDIIAEFQLNDESAMNLLRAAQGSAAQTLIALASSANSETVKLNANREILDRVLGRPVQFVNTQKLNSGPIDPKVEAENLKREIERLSGTQVVQNNITQNVTYVGH